MDSQRDDLSWNLGIDRETGHLHRPATVLCCDDSAADFAATQLGDRQPDRDGAGAHAGARAGEGAGARAGARAGEGAADFDLSFLHRRAVGFRAVERAAQLVRSAKTYGLRVQLDTAFFSHCMPAAAMAGRCGAGHPVWGNPLWANPLWANPLWANPLWANAATANPLWANPLWANGGGVTANTLRSNPLWANPLWANSPPRNTAVPAEAPAGVAAGAGPVADDAAQVWILDSGIALGQAPALLDRVTGDKETPDRLPGTGDGQLDPVAGHGTFIAGLYEQLAPGCNVVVRSVIDPTGIGFESDMVSALHDLVDATPEELLLRTILNLSFGTYVLDELALFAEVVADLQLRGVTVVASAGNDGVCLPSYPAALPGVISVGALGPGGPTDFSNRGDWVRACANGVDLVSTFFSDFDGPADAGACSGDGRAGRDPDRFQGWATWTGTSFAAPVVGAALAQELNEGEETGEHAVEKLIDGPDALRLPCFGTVVHRC